MHQYSPSPICQIDKFVAYAIYSFETLLVTFSEMFQVTRCIINEEPVDLLTALNPFEPKIKF